MHACVSLASVAMVVTAAGDRSSPMWMVGGTILSILSIVMMGYAYRTFLWRAGEIGARSNTGQAHDPVGPAVLAGGVLLALLVCAWAVFV